MPTWTCPRCGQRIENFGWGQAPWKSHVCAAAAEAAPAPAAPEPSPKTAPEPDGGVQADIAGLLKDKKKSLSDFL